MDMERVDTIREEPSPRETREEGLSGLGGGANQAGGRAYNERLALSLIRLNGPLSRAELARLTGLTPQTLSHIVKRLEEEALLLPLAPLRGRIGQPSTPYALNPEGAFSFGVKIGRRSTEIVLCDFIGNIRDRARQNHPYPEPEAIFAFITARISVMRAAQKVGMRVAGLGIAMPFELWKWAEEVNAPAGLLESWRHLDVVAELEARTGLPTHLANDATAACGAELARNPKSAGQDWLYIFIGSFVGGGIVLNGALYQGRTRNAGAIGSMPVYLGGTPSQLIQHASLITLEKAVEAAGQDANLILNPEADWAGLGQVLENWMARAARALAMASVSGASVIDVQRVVVDGALPRDVLTRLVEETRAHLAAIAQDGLSPFEIEPGEIGADARALGGAILPMSANFSCGQDVLLKR
jgi:predicted NBD/HSP70 family sugar kinase